jgi:AcrR family transcriptional regulator
VLTGEHSGRLAAAVIHVAKDLTPPQAGGRDSFMRAAWEILGESGPDAVTVSALCERVGLSKSSFYHRFGTMAGFVQALAKYWEAAFDAVIDAYSSEVDPVRRLEGACQAALAMPWPATRAWQNWGWTDPVIAASLLRAERRAEQVITAALAELFDDPEKATLVGKMAVGLAVGLQTRYPPTDLEEYARIATAWARHCAGLDAELVHAEGTFQIRLARPGPRVMAATRPGWPRAAAER